MCPEEHLSTIAPDWKARARERFEAWLASLDAEPTPGDAPDSQTPDLHSFYSELAALRTEVRTMGRRTHEALSRFAEVLDGFDGGAVNTPAQGIDQDMPLAHALADLHMRFSRLSSGFSQPPKRGLFGEERGLRTAWNVQADAFRLVAAHLDETLRLAGIDVVQTSGAVFDPSIMVAVQSSRNDSLPDMSVVEQISPAYTRQGTVVRYAEVHVSTKAGG